MLFGVAGASMTSDLENFWLGALLGALLAQILHLRSRVQSLHEQLQSLKERRRRHRHRKLCQHRSPRPPLPQIELRHDKLHRLCRLALLKLGIRPCRRALLRRRSPRVSTACSASS